MDVNYRRRDKYLRDKILINVPERRDFDASVSTRCNCRPRSRGNFADAFHLRRKRRKFSCPDALSLPGHNVDQQHRAIACTFLLRVTQIMSAMTHSWNTTLSINVDIELNITTRSLFSFRPVQLTLHYANCDSRVRVHARTYVLTYVCIYRSRSTYLLPIIITTKWTLPQELFYTYASYLQRCLILNITSDGTTSQSNRC